MSVIAGKVEGQRALFVIEMTNVPGPATGPKASGKAEPVAVDATVFMFPDRDEVQIHGAATVRGPVPLATMSLREMDARIIDQHRDRRDATRRMKLDPLPPDTAMPE